MALLNILPALVIIASCLPIMETGAESSDSVPLLQQLFTTLIRSITDITRTLISPPQNKISSIGYRLYTARNPKKPCFIEPNQKALRSCPVDPAHLTIFLLHGYMIDLNHGNLYDELKDALLQKTPCNVIIVDWTKYDGPPYVLAITNIYTIGSEIATLIKYLMKYAGISTANIILIGHSLGAHMAGAVGKHLPNLRRIDGLDPAGPYFDTPIHSRLQYSDANFVQVIHSSNEIHGVGLEDPIGHMDFYINGGKRQIHCEYGSHYRRPNGEDVTIDSLLIRRFCHHEIVMQYYIDSINSTECTFLGTMCDTYYNFMEGKCPPENSTVGVMGAYGSQIPNLSPLSKFYLRTSKFSPYCLIDGYKPPKK